jgi:hypothetical protein
MAAIVAKLTIPISDDVPAGRLETLMAAVERAARDAVDALAEQNVTPASLVKVRVRFDPSSAFVTKP